jgi:Ca2+-binding EF-hand superfamily protein
MEGKEDKKDAADGMSAEEIREKLMDYEMKSWQEDRGKYVEFDIKTMNKYQKYYEEMTTINPDGEEGIGVDQLEEPFISLGLAYNREEINNLISSVDDDGSGRIEFGEFLRIIHNKSKLKTQGNKKITTFFKQLANDKLGGDSDLKHFSFKTIMDIMRRKNLLKAFLSKNPEEKKEGEKVLKAYSEMLQKRKNK